MTNSNNNNKTKIFIDVASNNVWGDPDSKSGPGSNLIQTKKIRNEIVSLIKEFNIKTMLDAPCGDFFWMREIKQELYSLLDCYIGGDIVPTLIKSNNKKFGNDKLSFKLIDITESQLPKVDLILTRDCFIHLSYNNIYKAIRNYKKSGSLFLLVSTYTNPRRNIDVDDVYIDGRALNFERFPFNFSKPLLVINEGCTESNGQYSDKSLALWELQSINLLTLRVYLALKSIKVWLQKNIALRHA